MAEPVRLSDKYAKWLSYAVGLVIALVLVGMIIKFFAKGGPADVAVLYKYGTQDAGDDYTPAVAYGQGQWVVVWSSDDALNKTKQSTKDILYSTSSDAKSWANPKAIASDPALKGADDAEPDIATDGQGKWFVVWSSAANLGGKLNDDYDIIGLRSMDNGATWKDLGAVANNADNDSEGWCLYGCTPGKREDDWAPRIATKGSTWRVAWTGKSRVINVAQSGCQDYSKPPMIHTQVTKNIADLPNVSWLGPYCVGTPEDNLAAALAADKAGNWVLPFISSGSVLTANLGPDYDVLVTYGNDTQWPVFSHPWNLPQALSNYASQDSEHDLMPAIAVAGNVWVAVWQSAVPMLQQGSQTLSLGTDYDIFAAMSVDAGKTWSAPVPVNSNAASDAGDDITPRIATNGSDWVVVWASKDTLGGMLGSDFDILIATSKDNGATWAPAKALAKNAGSDLGDDTAPALTTDGNKWVVVWQSLEDGGSGPDSDLLFSAFTLPLP